MKSNAYASLVVLSYHRPDYLAESLDSLRENSAVGIPYELIVVDDGSHDACWTYLMQCARQCLVSTVIINAGSNLGVGEGMRRGFDVATGDYLVKLDADLKYKFGWLAAGVKILEEDKETACVGFFDYRNYTPDDDRFNILERRKIGELEYGIVDDFVSSAMIFKRDTFNKYGPLDSGSDAFAEDVMFKRKLQENGLKCAITIPDYIKNIGFGLGRSEVVKLGSDGKPQVTKISHRPLIFGRTP